MRIRTIVLTCLSSLLVSCSEAHGSASHGDQSAPTSLYKLERVGEGLACYVPDAKTYGVVMYPVQTIGKPGVPDLNAGQVALVGKIEKYFKPKTLRFFFSTRTFIIFNLTGDPCGEYRALNESCNLSVDPVDRLDGLGAFPGGCRNMARPWIPGDANNGNVPWQWWYGPI
jgi:hypothetical protein